MREQHLTPLRVEEIIESGSISIQEAEHAKECQTCNGWLRAFVDMAVIGGASITFEVPAPISEEQKRDSEKF